MFPAFDLCGTSVVSLTGTRRSLLSFSKIEVYYLLINHKKRSAAVQPSNGASQVKLNRISAAGYQKNKLRRHAMTEETKKISNVTSPFLQHTAIILAGGLGTRLQSVVPDLPKCMATVAGKPFISFVIQYLRMQGIQKFIFSLGYRHEVIQNYLEKEYPTLQYEVVIEKEPLGTGGAIKAALEKATSNEVLIANGDTLFKINAAQLSATHLEKGAACTVALKPMQDFDRYGVVAINERNQISSFKEKQPYTKGLINGGIYLVNKAAFLNRDLPQIFSFEKDYLEKFVSEGFFYGSVQDGYFIDIGIPQDYQKAQSDLEASVLDLTKIDDTWTLFLDRDGVINEERVGNYILHWSDFIFSPGVLEAWKILSKKFKTIIIISNQRGVGKLVMTEDTLKEIHLEMEKEVEGSGGHIDKIYYCTEVDDKHFNRKPNPGMALLAAADFTQIDFSKALMVGNKPSDARFGKAAGMFTIFVATTTPEMRYPHPDVDLRFNTLLEFAQALQP